MPWKESGPMEERMRFVVAHQSGLYTMSELCRGFGISRRIGYKWLARFGAEGVAGLRDRSRAPKSSPQQMDPFCEAVLLEAKKAHLHWGPRKILAWVRKQHPALAEALPAASTVGELFARHALVERRPRRPRPPRTIAGALQAGEPNEVWTADYKGEFRLSTGRYCYPFTLADACSRYLLACRAQSATSLAGAQEGFREAFRTYGLPRAIRTDNGSPFVGQGRSGLSTLLVWWIQLGIRHQRIPPGRPDQNGRHERMHRTLKAETTRSPGATLAHQQQRFDAFVAEYNEERPHEALGQQTPASRYECSPRPYPERIAPPEYPGHFERRKVDGSGRFKFARRVFFVAQPLASQWLGLREIEEDLWSVQYYDHELGRIDSSTGAFVVKVLPMSPV